MLKKWHQGTTVQVFEVHSGKWLFAGQDEQSMDLGQRYLQSTTSTDSQSATGIPLGRGNIVNLVLKEISVHFIVYFDLYFFNILSCQFAF